MGLVADVFLVNLIDDNGNVIGTSTLQDGNIDVSVSENDVRAGRGNQLLAVLHSDRDISISLTDAEFKYDWLAKQLGQDISTGAGVAYAMPKWHTVEGDSTNGYYVTVENTPKTVADTAVYDINGSKVTVDSVSANTIDVSGVVVGDEVEVRTYTYDSNATTETITIDNTVFAKGVKAVLETIEINEEEEATHTIQWQFDKALPSGSFTINTSSERSANTQEFNLRVVKPRTSTEVGRVMRIPVA